MSWGRAAHIVIASDGYGRQVPATANSNVCRVRSGSTSEQQLPPRLRYQFSPTSSHPRPGVAGGRYETVLVRFTTARPIYPGDPLRSRQRSAAIQCPPIGWRTLTMHHTNRLRQRVNDSLRSEATIVAASIREEISTFPNFCAISRRHR